MISFQDIAACLVTRGNVPMEPILKTLPYEEVVIWDNSEREEDAKVFGRHLCLREVTTEYVYFQDDDVIFTEHEALLTAFNLELLAHSQAPRMVAVDAHGDNYGGYEDLCWTGAGSIVSKQLAMDTWWRWFGTYYDLRYDGEFLYEADAVFGILCPHMMVKLPYERLYADDDTRLCRQPWQEGLKLKYANMAREIRDAV